jgi:cold-inducible RNA-binding protein
MGTRIYVGNLPYTVTNDQLGQLFAPYGEVSVVHVVMDRDTGRSKGFGFVDLADAAVARRAIAELNGLPMGDRTLTVNEARPREDRPQRGGPRW